LLIVFVNFNINNGGFMSKINEQFFKFERYVYLLSSIVKDYCIYSMEEEDLFQLGRVWLMEALIKYPEGKKQREEKNKLIKDKDKRYPLGSVSTFVYMFLKCRYINLENMKYSKSKKNKNKKVIRVDSNYLFSDNFIIDNFADSNTLSMESNNTFRIDFLKIMYSLSSYERALLYTVFIEEKSLAKITEFLSEHEEKSKFSPSKIKKTMKIIKDKFKPLTDLEEEK